MTAIARRNETSLVVQRERDRLRCEAGKGVCPTCGRSKNADLERQINSYAQANSRLHALLARAGVEVEA